MILCDTGPLIALTNLRDPDHARCEAVFRVLQTELLTTWSCLTEAMYFLGRDGGWNLQRELWGMRSIGILRIHESTNADEQRMQELMEQYRDLPMDLADATLVATAEATGLRRIFTLDSDFRIYRLADGSSFEIVP